MSSKPSLGRQPSSGSFYRKDPPPPPSAAATSRVVAAPPPYTSTPSSSSITKKAPPPPPPLKPKPSFNVKYATALFDFEAQVSRPHCPGSFRSA